LSNRYRTSTDASSGCILCYVRSVLLTSLTCVAATLALPPSSTSVRGRGNTVLQQPLDTRVLSVAANLRMGILLSSGAAFIQPPLGFGFGFDLRYHVVRLGPMRFGFEFQAGHTRFPSRATLVGIDPGSGLAAATPRWTILAHTDITFGPSFQIPMGPVFLQVGAGGGLAISSFRRPTGVDPRDDQQVVGYEPTIRADAAIAIPIVRNQGILLGANYHKIWSNQRIISDLDAPVDTQPDSAVFDMHLDIHVAYQMWFF